MCKYEKGYNDTVCDNLYDYPDEQVEVKRRKKTLSFFHFETHFVQVQLRVNDFQEAGQWLAQGPGEI